MWSLNTFCRTLLSCHPVARDIKQCVALHCLNIKYSVSEPVEGCKDPLVQILNGQYV